MTATAMATTAPLVPHARVTLRAAGPGDSERIWSYNFAPDVRAQSRRPEIVPLVDHARWYAKRLADAGSPIWIVEEWGTPVGVVRLDRRGETTVMSIALGGSARGRGIGRAAIAAACAAWQRPILADVFIDNYRSRVCFEACGFRQLCETDSLVTYRWSPEP